MLGSRINQASREVRSWSTASSSSSSATEGCPSTSAMLC